MNIARDAKQMREQGKSLREIRAAIDGRYSQVGPGTPTQMPP
ncbi:MAG: hypothetical protein HY684_02745 [Chloroflexi bacterium]|nr:hypothetical protein [Chloroflexota bacterium]